MMTLHTIAIYSEGCFSALLWNKRPFGVALERTFENDRVVIPGGRTVCQRTKYHKGGYETFEIMVPGHTRVLFHLGNEEEDSTACVLTGEQFILLPNGRAGVGQSGVAFQEMMKLTKGLNMFPLEVTGR